jgi:hypothetical protein
VTPSIGNAYKTVQTLLLDIGLMLGDFVFNNALLPSLHLYQPETAFKTAVKDYTETL